MGCGQKKTEIVCHWSLLMLLDLAEQSKQLRKCHISRWRLCHRSPQDKQSKSWKKVWPLFFCHWSLHTPLAPAEQSIQLLIGAEQQLLLYQSVKKDNQSISWEKVWANWNCLLLVSSHVVGTSRAEHTTSYMSYKQMKTLLSVTTRQPIQILKKSWSLFFYFIDHFSCH
jgi:hypothetical protein